MSNTGGGGGEAANVLTTYKGGNGGSGIVVIIRYKTTKITSSTVQQTGFLNYTNADGWLLSQVSAGTTSPLTNILTSSGTGMFQVVANAGTQLNNPILGKLFITTVGNSTPQIANNTMVNHLEVNSSTRIDGKLHIVETTGTVFGANSGSIILDHENNGGASSITFRSRANRGSDYGYIQYQYDTSSLGASGESARLIIGTQNDADDHIILLPSGNVGIGLNNPTRKLHVNGDMSVASIFCTYIQLVSANFSTGLSAGTINVGDLIASGNMYANSTFFMAGDPYFILTVKDEIIIEEVEVIQVFFLISGEIKMTRVLCH